MGDAWNYWSASLPGGYERGANTEGMFLYSPAAFAALLPFRLLPWEVFAAIWFALHIWALWWMRVPWLIVFPGVMDDVVRGNVNTFLAVAVVLVIRRGPAAWIALILTKVTPGIGLVWHVVRREWQPLAVAIGSTLLLVAVGWLAYPSLWMDWVHSLLVRPTDYPSINVLGPLVLRLPVAGIVIAAAGLKNWTWALPVGLVLAMPGVGLSSLALLSACVPLWHRRGRPFGPTTA